MNPESYKSIRQKNNFFYLYFTECGGKMPEPIFNFALPMWLNSASGMRIDQAKKKLIKFLDEKFGYTG